MNLETIKTKEFVAWIEGVIMNELEELQENIIEAHQIWRNSQARIIEIKTKEKTEFAKAGKFFEQGDSAIKIIGKDKKGNIEFLVLNERFNGCDIKCALESCYIDLHDENFDNFFVKEITKKQFEERIIERFKEILEANNWGV